MAQQHNYGRIRFGMTLVELLMVVAIMTILLAIAIPMVRPAFQDRQLREASRQINAFFAGAKARAAETGRPAGVWIEASGLPGDPQYAVRLFMAEVSPGFTGEVIGARATVELTSATSGQLYFGDEFGQNLVQSPAILSSLVADGEEFFIRFDHKGPKYNCQRTGLLFEIALPTGVVPRGAENPPLSTSARPGLTYEITRSPSKSIVSPLTLPGDAVIDLGLSGVGISATANVFQLATPIAPVVIMFNPSGLPGAVYVNNNDYTAGGSIYLLVGRRAKVIATEAPPGTVNPELINPELSNLADPANFWVTINNRTGAVTTEDNAVATNLPSTPTVADYIKATREFARGSRQKGGR